MALASRSFSDQLLMLLPAAFGIMMVLAGALPSLFNGVDIYPHMALLMTCFWVNHYRAAWPLWFVFVLGILQDTVNGTPLATQALLLMAAFAVVRHQARQVNRQNFRMLWIEVAIVTVGYMAGMWLLMSWATHRWLPLWPVCKEAVVSVALYPLVHILLQFILRLLPPLR